MRRTYWRLRAAWARWRTRHDPRPSIDDLLDRDQPFFTVDGVRYDGRIILAEWRAYQRRYMDRDVQPHAAEDGGGR